jgi:hypothetical protein
VVATGQCDHEVNKEPVPYASMLNLTNFVWTDLPPENKPGTGCTLIAFNDELVFKFGGVDSHGRPINCIEKLDA